MDNQLTARTEIAAAINQICSERNIPVSIVVDSVKAALAASFRKDYPQEAEAIEAEEYIIEGDFDPNTGEYRLFKGHEGDTIKDMTEITPPGFGRIAAQTAKQVILQKIREAERSAVISDYRDRVGEIINGMILRLDGQNVIVDLGRGTGFMPAEEQVRSEYYRLNSRLAFLISDIRETPRGETIIVSRSDPRLVSGLFAREVPEVGSGAVTVKAIAREAGNRTKIAVTSNQDGVDPVGSCVGQKGVRVQAVINELNGEKIDIIQYSENLTDFVKSSLAPADGLEIDFDKNTNTLTVTVPHDQLSLAIGRGGQNVRLAAQLAGASIKIKSDETDPGITVTGSEEYEIDQLGLDTKIRNLLIEAKMTRIDDLSTEGKLDSVKGIGPKSLEQIKAKLLAYQPTGEKA
jgi:transcription termination/antitermination protein NusA